MGQYHKVVNLDKREFIHPHELGSGLKQWEQIANNPGTPHALFILCCCSNGRGGGDFDLYRNAHGAGRTSRAADEPLEAPYQETALAVIGRWAGDRIAVVGDYTEDRDLPGSDTPASLIYRLCGVTPEDLDEDEKLRELVKKHNPYQNITSLVAKVIEHELCGHYTGDGWKTWEPVERAKYTS